MRAAYIIHNKRYGFFLHPSNSPPLPFHFFLHAPCEEEEVQGKIGPNQKSHFIFIDIILSGGQKFHSGYLGCPQSTTTVTQISQTNSFNPNTALHTMHQYLFEYMLRATQRNVKQNDCMAAQNGAFRVDLNCLLQCDF